MFSLPSFVLGTIIGSFLNVWALRYNTGKSLGGRSGCFSCGAPLRWYELVPLVSFMVQCGHCRSCGAKISWQYPLVELATGLLFAFLIPSRFFSFDFSVVELISTLITVFVFCLLMVITIYDIHHKIIPDALVFTFIGISFASIFFENGALLWPGWWAVSAGVIIFLPFFILWFVSRGRWIGLGDGKLVAGMGWFLGLSGAISSVILAFWIGAVWSIFALFLSRRHLTMKSELPFAPFLILGFLIVFFWHIDPLNLNEFFLTQ